MRANPGCGTSRNALAAIRAAGQEPQIVEYPTTPLTRGAIAALVKGMSISTRSLVRTQEPLFRELGLGDRDLRESELLDATAENPILIDRPIVVLDDREKTTVRLCRPSEQVKAMLVPESVQ